MKEGEKLLRQAEIAFESWVSDHEARTSSRSVSFCLMYGRIMAEKKDMESSSASKKLMSNLPERNIEIDVIESIPTSTEKTVASARKMLDRKREESVRKIEGTGGTKGGDHNSL